MLASAITAHVMRHQCTKAFRTIPRAALAAIRWKSTPCRPHELPVCRAGTRREWAWGAREDATNHTRMQQAYLSSPTSPMFHTRQHTVESFPADGGDSQDDIAPNDEEQDSQVHGDISRGGDCFIPLGVEPQAPSPPNKEAVKAQNRAFWLLSQRTYTRHRLEQKLLSYKKFPDDAVAWAMQRVEALGYIDDAAWSRDYAKQKWRYSRWATRRISRELRQRGIDADTIESTLEWLQTEGQQGRRSDGTLAPPAADAEEAAANMHAVLVADARKKLVRLSRYPIATQRRRLSSWLARLGHDWGVAQQVLREVELL